MIVAVIQIQTRAFQSHSCQHELIYICLIMGFPEEDKGSCWRPTWCAVVAYECEGSNTLHSYGVQIPRDRETLLDTCLLCHDFCISWSNIVDAWSLSVFHIIFYMQRYSARKQVRSVVFKQQLICFFVKELEESRVVCVCLFACLFVRLFSEFWRKSLVYTGSD